ncbi:hypothetical protein T265_03570 [Opisthorchis viverrini]|uniref:Uncharacterized protein n=1 Tax=Opisthorchis viverrini TaxID=6198 RepID=A0A074ZVG5_OPIVI|nr:hypothetical protein T265_03570 [Opisthorchis viverrini]KER29872.1 hypothetical protein T265_03570 [Opisthorchis viverrini]
MDAPTHPLIVNCTEIKSESIIRRRQAQYSCNLSRSVKQSSSEQRRREIGWYLNELPTDGGKNEQKLHKGSDIYEAYESSPARILL